jgi:stage II sporulation protein D
VTVEGNDEAAVAATSNAVKLRLLVAAALLVAILLLVLQATPPFPTSGPPAGGAPFFEAEPQVRVRVGILEPGQEITVHGLEGRRAGGARVANKGGSLEIGGEPVQLPAVLSPAKGAEVGLGDRRYQGDLAVAREPGSARILLVNRLGIEAYLEGVVLSEMPPDSPDEALFAQVIASRSYAAWQMTARKDRDFDVTDSQRSQVYRGAPAQLALARRVVAATRGRVLTYGGKVVEAVFSSTCGGTTRSAAEAFGDESIPPLRGVTCGFCDGTQFAQWTAKVKRADAGRALSLGGPVTALADHKLHPSGRLAQVDVRGDKASRKITGNQLRDLLGPAGRSSWFTKAEVSGDWIVAEGRGFGHGAGMCQVGAAKLASAGRSAHWILAHYYPDALLGWLYPVHES